MTLKLPRKANQPISISAFAIDHRRNSISIQFQTEDYMGPLDVLGGVTVKAETLYSLLLSLKEEPYR